MKTASTDRHQSLVQWVSQATGINTFGVKVQLQGNDLHILCEDQECPQRWRTLADLLQALQQTDLQLLTGEQPSIYQVLVYGRKKGESRPQWCHKVYLNQLDQHLEEVKQAILADAEKSKQAGGSLIISNESLARQGDLDAVARYLSETLSTFGVSVLVKVKPQQSPKNDQSNNRLWIFCQSSYSPDPSLLGEPIAQKLRYLKLSGYQDAVIVSQVRGETQPDWQMRVDLTPPEVMLKEWARWGDVQAIARLLTEVLSTLQVTVQASLQESTLHIFCQPAVDPAKTEPAPDKNLCLQIIVPQLEAIAPQGILAATIYGQKTADKQPTWIDWLALPAKEHPALAPSPLELATSGDEPAITFLLERLLNPDLEWRLKTGGIRVLLLRKGDLLHIMCDAPVCPSIKQVAQKVTQFIRQLKVPQIFGVRVYGRRAGNKEPFWHHGEDFVHRQRQVPEAVPEFAATVLYVNELLFPQSSEPILRADVTPAAVQTLIKEVAQDWLTTATTKAKNLLITTQLFTEIDQPVEQTADTQGLKIALVWGTLGLLLTLQTDWILGQMITHWQQNQSAVAKVSNSPPPKSALKSPENSDQRTAFFTANSQTKSSLDKNSGFNSSGFLQNDDTQTGNLAATPLKAKATSKAMLAVARSQMPSFNSRQLDEQIILYKQRLAKTGSPPEVLIIGSSRALRGIDPAALSQALAIQGYQSIDVFNFGVNGATAQVVDFVIRKLLEPSQLPKLILWADGSRAFNSGRDDITFNAIAASPGYKRLLKKNLDNTSGENLSTNSTNTLETEKTIGIKPAESNNYQAINQVLNQGLATLSVSYQNREEIKTLLIKQLSLLPFASDRSWLITPKSKRTNNNLEDNVSQAVDFDGFLPLDIRFNSAEYYQRHRKVFGNDDRDYISFQIAGIQDTAFKTLLDFTESQRINLVFINTPLTDEYLDPARQQHEQTFQQYMTGFSNNPNFLYRDFSQIWLKSHEYFSDPSHLNRFGAYEVSQKLARDPMISWPAR
ncbi:hypothetical protein [Fortiea contorta]|uniref:hypothetical protein n=1 Tax=Fortiea contorta TaxID=1892405 RepID=UPI00034DEAFF|nr:hypothetical protein [Fortiea contorta]